MTHGRFLYSRLPRVPTPSLRKAPPRAWRARWTPRLARRSACAGSAAPCRSANETRRHEARRRTHKMCLGSFSFFFFFGGGCCSKRIDLSTLWFSHFGPYVVMAPKGDHLLVPGALSYIFPCFPYIPYVFIGVPDVGQLLVWVWNIRLGGNLKDILPGLDGCLRGFFSLEQGSGLQGRPNIDLAHPSDPATTVLEVEIV